MSKSLATVAEWGVPGLGLESATDLEVFQSAAAELVAEAGSEERLLRYHSQLSEVAALLNASDPAHGARGALVSSLAAMVAGLLEPHAQSGRAARETDALASLVRTRANALPVLRELAQGHHRPAEIRAHTGLSDPQIFRVLSWAVSNGLVSRWEKGRVTQYGVTGLGELVLKTVDEPSWLAPAVTLVRLVAEEIAAERAPRAIAEDAAALMGVPVEQVARGMDLITQAMAPVVSAPPPSPLLEALGMERPITFISAAAVREFEHSNVRLVEKGMVFRLNSPGHVSPTQRREAWWYSCAEAEVVRSLERAGVPAAQLDEWMVSRKFFHADGQSRTIPLTDPVLALSVRAAPAAALLRAYGQPLLVTPQEIQLRTTGGASQFSPHHPVGFFVRLFDPRSGVSHFAVGGNTVAATLAAAKAFRELADELLTQFQQRPFGVAVSVGVTPLSADRIEYSLMHVAEIETEVPEADCLRVCSSAAGSDLIAMLPSGRSSDGSPPPYERRSGKDRRAPAL